MSWFRRDSTQELLETAQHLLGQLTEAAVQIRTAAEISMEAADHLRSAAERVTEEHRDE